MEAFTFFLKLSLCMTQGSDLFGLCVNMSGTCREFLRDRGSNLKKGGNYRAKDWIHYYFIFLQEVTYSHPVCIYLIKYNFNIRY